MKTLPLEDYICTEFKYRMRRKFQMTTDLFILYVKSQKIFFEIPNEIIGLNFKETLKWTTSNGTTFLGAPCSIWNICKIFNNREFKL